MSGVEARGEIDTFGHAIHAATAIKSFWGIHCKLERTCEGSKEIYITRKKSTKVLSFTGR